jgi:hypothetical protein
VPSQHRRTRDPPRRAPRHRHPGGGPPGCPLRQRRGQGHGDLWWRRLGYASRPSRSCGSSASVQRFSMIEY